MSCPVSPFKFTLLTLMFLALTAFAGSAQTQDPEVAQLQAALAANRTNQAVLACVERERDIARFGYAVHDLQNVRDPNQGANFYCGFIGANVQERAPQACCEAFERDQPRRGNEAWIEMQACGLRARIAERRPAFVAAANKCLTAASVAPVPFPPPTPLPPRTTELSNAWRDVPAFDQIRPQIVGHDACAVTGGAAWNMLDNAGRQRSLPGFLADRIQRGYAVLDDRVWLQTAVASLRGAPSPDDAIARMPAGGPGTEKQFVWFGETFVRHYLPNASLATVVGREEGVPIARISSEHGSIRGTCNGGGDFIRFTPRASGPRIVRAAWTPSPTVDADVRLEMPSALVTADGGFARVVADLAPNGAAAILVTAGRVHVRETTTGTSQRVAAGEAVLVWPGLGVSAPVRVGADRFSAVSRPRIRGSVVLQPGQEWSGPLRVEEGFLPLEARLLYEKPAGGAYALEIAVNGERVVDPVLNKMSPLRYADGRNYPYREPNSARWLLFYSHDYAANNGPVGGQYEVKTDPGQAYRYVWNVASMLGGNPTAQVRLRNGSAPGGPTLEVRLLPSGPLNRYTTTPPPPATPAAPGKPKSGLFDGLVDALKDVAKEVARPSLPTGVTPPAPPPAETAAVPYGSPSAQGQPHLAIYTVPRILAHGDFDYPVVVQLQDGSGRPMYPSAPLTVTVTSGNPDVVKMYLPNRPSTTTLTLKPPDRAGRGGLSWEKVQVIAANHWVAGSATITATAPGLPAASVTVTTIPTRTPDNRSVPAQTAPAASVGFTVMPPIVETDRRPVIAIDLLDARGDPTGIDFGPGEWTLESSNPGVFPRYESSGRNAILNPTGPGQTQLTIRPKRPGLTGASAPLSVIAPGAPATTKDAAPPAAAAPPSAATGQVVPDAAFGEPAVSSGSSGGVSNIVTARDVRNGTAIGITDRFTPDVNPIHVWFRIAGFAPGTMLLSRWTYLGGQQPLVIGTAELVIGATNDYGTFNYELAPGKQWPAGDYRIEILFDRSVIGSTTFVVSGGNHP